MVSAISARQQTTQLLVIDQNINGWQDLANNAGIGVSVLILNPLQDGLTQIANAVTAYSNLDAIQILSHGSVASLQLGATTLNGDNLSHYTEQLTTIGNALSENGDLLLYGCNVAQGDAGQQFIEQLSVLTGADVAASTNLTGDVAQGGDWLLETQTGAIEASSAISVQAQAAYHSTLATTLGVFAATDATNGTELWVTDGTAAGTSLLKDIYVGILSSSPHAITSLGNGKAVFVATGITSPSNYSYDVWITDGTTSAILVKDIRSPYSDSQFFFTSLGNGKALFSGSFDANLNRNLWVTDGTAAGTNTIVVGSFIYYPESIVVLGNGKALFSAHDSTNGSGLWITDGSTAGTSLVKGSFNPTFSPDPPQYLTSLGNGKALFNAPSSNGYGLWITDGTTAGTGLFKDIVAGIDNARPIFLGNGKAVLDVYNATTGHELWFTDGTALGTHFVKNGMGSFDSTSFTTLGNGKVLFSTTLGLWVTDETTAGTTLVKNIFIGTGNPYSQIITSLGNGKAVFSAYDSTNGYELWVTDGTTAGTNLVKDINVGINGSKPQFFTALGNGKATFSATDANNDTELWITDGTAAGTSLLKDINPATQSSSPSAVTLITGTNTNTNTAPNVLAGSTTVFTEQTPVTVAGTMTINDLNGDADWNGGKLQVQITANNTINDSLALPTANNGGIWLNPTGNLLMANTIIIGTANASTVSNGSAWTFIFNASATNALVQSTARAIQFINNSDAPSTASRTVTFTATDKNAAFNSSVQTVSITAVNDTPTLTSFTSTVANGNEDSEIAVTFASLQAQGNEADADGTVTAFIIKAVTSGTLKIGTDALTATAWSASNNTVDATHQAYWTPALNANGTLNAFTAVAKDNGGLESLTAIQATVSIVAVNDAPTLTSFTSTVANGNEDSEIAVTFASLQAQGNEADADGTVTAFVIKAVTSGTLKIGTDALTATAWSASNNTVDATHQAYWTPALNANGTLNAFTAVAKDNGGLESLTPVQATVNIGAVNDAPTLTSFTSTVTNGNEDSEIAVTFASLQAQGNEADADGTVTAFIIKAVTSGTLKIGTDALTATAWSASNNTVDATHQAYWTPALNANGILNAFTAVAKDNGGLESLTPVQATVSITAVNDTPTLTSFTSTVANGNEDSEIAVTFASLQAQGNEADADGTVTAFVIKAVTSGTLKIGTDALTATAWSASNNTVDATHQAYWTPVLNANGTLNAFTAVAKDNGGLESITLIQAKVSIAAVNDIPVGIVTITGIAAQGQTLMASNNLTDADGMGVVTYTWMSGTNVVATGGSYTLVQSDVGKVIAVIAKYTDGQGTLESRSSIPTSAVTNLNHAPVLTTPATISYTDTQYVDNFVTATGTLVGSDVDSPVLTYGITGIGVADNGTTMSISNAYGLLTMTKATGAYSFAPNSAGIEPLIANTTSTFTVTVSDDFLIVSKPLTIAIKQSGITESNGSDVLLNGVGVNHWAGLQGDDTYYVDVAGDVITENVGGGTDIVYSTATSYILADNVENLVIWGAGVNGTGNALSNYIFGSTGNNTIDGGLGADIMYGDLGSDAYYVDNIGDVTVEIGTDWDVVYSTAASYTLNANIEVLFLIDGVNRNGNGNSQNNYLLGNTGNNILDGKGGADVMVGYAGNDTYYVDNVGDSVIENASEGFDTVNSSINYTLTANVEALTLMGAATQGFGNNLNNTLTGNSANNILGGGVGADTMIGGVGNDTYYVDDALDSIIENVGEGADIVYSTAASYTLADNVESLIIWGAGVNGTGSNQANYIISGAGNNMLDGRAGNDVLYGDEGADTYIGGLGADSLNLTEATAATDTVRIATGDSLATVGGYDLVTRFKLGTGVLNTTGVDKLDLANTVIAANVTAADGIDSGVIRSHSINKGIISFDDINNYTSPLAISASTNLVNVFSYLQTNITGGNTVAFISEGNTFVFQDGGVTDTLVELLGVTTTNVNNTGLGANSVWVI